VREVVDGEGELVSVGALAALGHDHAGIVDERVELSGLFREGANLSQVSEVGDQARLGADVVDRRVDLLRITPVDEDARPALCQLRRDPPAVPVGGAGDQDALLGERPNRRGSSCRAR
jgi:hypothetical protein